MSKSRVPIIICAGVLIALFGAEWHAAAPPHAGSQGVYSSPTQGPVGATGAAGASYLSGTSSAIGGGLLAAGACTSGTATVTGATTAMAAVASPVTYPGDGAQYQAYVSSANTVTVKVCVLLLLTPTSTTYRVRVLP